eukprot:526476-Amphidinium_carterae.1
MSGCFVLMARCTKEQQQPAQWPTAPENMAPYHNACNHHSIAGGGGGGWSPTQPSSPVAFNVGGGCNK